MRHLKIYLFVLRPRISVLLRAGMPHFLTSPPTICRYFGKGELEEYNQLLKDKETFIQIQKDTIDLLDAKKQVDAELIRQMDNRDKMINDDIESIKSLGLSYKPNTNEGKTVLIQPV